MVLMHVLFMAPWIICVAISPILAAIAVSTCSAMCYAWRTPDTLQSTRFRSGSIGPARAFSIIVPVREEVEMVLRATIDRLTAQGYPHLEVIISVGINDLETRATAERIAADHDAVRVSVNVDTVRNKPRQLNSALLDCSGDVVGIFDAESLAAPGLLAEIDAVFADSTVDIVQGAVQLVNFDDSWFSLQNCLEYFFWFRSRLHLQAVKGFIPLGGNTVFIRRQVLIAAGGYDGDCLAEDCELGVRLSTRGHRTAVAYDPALATREETPGTLRALIKQRTRWDLGFMQVLSKGLWRSLPTRRKRLLARFTLMQPFLQAATGAAVPLAVLAIVAGHAPLWVAFTTFVPLLLMAAMVGFQVAGLHELGRDFGLPVRARHYAQLVISTPVYQVVLAVAALRAVSRFHHGNFAWEKTTHVGAHLDPMLVVPMTEPERHNMPVAAVVENLVLAGVEPTP